MLPKLYPPLGPFAGGKELLAEESKLGTSQVPILIDKLEQKFELAYRRSVLLIVVVPILSLIIFTVLTAYLLYALIWQRELITMGIVVLDAASFGTGLLALIFRNQIKLIVQITTIAPLLSLSLVENPEAREKYLDRIWDLLSELGDKGSHELTAYIRNRLRSKKSTDRHKR